MAEHPLSWDFAAGHVPDEPFTLFQEWMEVAERRSGMDNPNAMCLSTVGAGGDPHGRIVLLKGYDERGFVFFTNHDSRKGLDLAANPKAALTLFWDALNRQVRIVGDVARVSNAESDEYFETRPRGSRVGAWASEQSRPIADRAALERQVEHAEATYAGRDVPRPPHWGGYVVSPRRIEFWQAGPYRLHDRLEYARRQDGGWDLIRLSP